MDTPSAPAHESVHFSMAIDSRRRPLRRAEQRLSPHGPATPFAEPAGPVASSRLRSLANALTRRRPGSLRSARGPTSSISNSIQPTTRALQRYRAREAPLVHARMDRAARQARAGNHLHQPQWAYGRVRRRYTVRWSPVALSVLLVLDGGHLYRGRFGGAHAPPRLPAELGSRPRRKTPSRPRSTPP